MKETHTNSSKNGGHKAHTMPMQGMHMAAAPDGQGGHDGHTKAGQNGRPKTQGGMDMPGAMGGHTGHGMMDMGDLKRRFWVCLILAVPVLLMSSMMGLARPLLRFPGSGWVLLALATALYFYGGKPFLSGAKGELAAKSPAMMTLISLGITVAYLYSVYAFVRNTFFPQRGHVMDFFWELATLIVIMLLGHWVEMRAVMSAGNATESMAKLLPTSATLVAKDGGTREVPLGEVQTGQTLLVPAGGKIPADGKVVQGETSVNEAMVTGEARAVQKHVGDTVIGGSVNGEGTVHIEVTGTGESGFLAQVAQLVGSAQQEKSKAELLSDRVAKWLFYVAVFAGLAAFVVWLLVSGSVDTALTRTVTVLVIACPHALGLAVPLVVARSTSLGAKGGLLLRSRQALETAVKVDTVAMDKTGTLTQGSFTVRAVHPLQSGVSEEDVLQAMAALESGSSHPLAQGILKAAAQRNLPVKAAQNQRNLPGEGVAGTLPDGREARLVSAKTLDRENIAYDAGIFKEQAKQGFSVSYLLVEGKATGLVAQGDTPKEGAAHLVKALTQRGIRPVMLTGDNAESANAVATALGLAETHAGMLPQDKEGWIRTARSEGHVVMMVGDGVNDAPSLARADIGMAIGAGTDVAIDSADVVLVRDDLGDIVRFLSLAGNTQRKMKQNLVWGAGYNIVAIPLAAGVLAPLGILLSPAVGALLMSLSTVIVAVNALTLKAGDA